MARGLGKKKLFKAIFADRFVEPRPDVHGARGPMPTYGDLVEGLVQVRERKRKKVNRTSKGSTSFKQVFDPEVGVRYEHVKGKTVKRAPYSLPGKKARKQKTQKIAAAMKDMGCGKKEIRGG